MSSPRKPIFGATVPELREAFCLFVKSQKKVWERDLELLLELALGPDFKHGRGWQRHERKRDCVLDDGLVSAEAVLRWIDSGDLEDLVSLQTPSPKGRRTPQTAAQDKEGEVLPLEEQMQSMSLSSFCELVETFNQFDADANGVICAKDLKYALEHLTGRHPSLQECKSMILKVDSNADGVVDLAEFIDMMNSNKAGLLQGH